MKSNEEGTKMSVFTLCTADRKTAGKIWEEFSGSVAMVSSDGIPVL